MKGSVLSIPDLLESKVLASIDEAELTADLEGCSLQKVVAVFKQESQRLFELKKRRVNGFDKAL